MRGASCSLGELAGDGVGASLASTLVDAFFGTEHRDPGDYDSLGPVLRRVSSIRIEDAGLLGRVQRSLA